SDLGSIGVAERRRGGMTGPYDVARVSVPEPGHDTDVVARSPTDPSSGLYSPTSTLPENFGLVADTEDDVGRTSTATTVPRIGQIVSSTSDESKSWLNSMSRLQSFRPPIRERNVLPMAVSSRSSASTLIVTDLTWSDRSTLLMLTYASVNAKVAMRSSLL